MCATIGSVSMAMRDNRPYSAKGEYILTDDKGQPLKAVPDTFWTWFLDQPWCKEKYPDYYEYATSIGVKSSAEEDYTSDALEDMDEPF